ncbi:TPA: Slam-dependent surface lipoprotein [Neisseria subflava]
MSIFKQTLLAAVLCGVFGVAVAAPDGGSSELKNVKPGQSDAIPFGAGKAGLRFVNGGNWSVSINLQNGPVQHIRNKYNDGKNPINGTDPYANVDGTRNSQYLMLRDVAPVIGWFYNPKLGQVWYENRHNNTEVYSVRQITEPKLFFAPKFSGLVIAKVPGMSEGNNVFFGEWAPRAGNPPKNSTDLNMADGKRTVWYVGDNPTGNTIGVRTATYNVLGINKHTPGQNDFYTGQVTATFGSGITGTMAGRISRSSDHVDFDHAKIDNRNGTFADPSQGMTGRFYGNQAAAMAGYTTRGTGNVGDDVAFGGSATDIETRK